MQVKLIIEESHQYLTSFPQVFTGDFNEDATNRVISLIKEAGWEDTYLAVNGPADPGFTGHGFLGPKHAEKSKKGKIDFIFGKGPVKSRAASVIRDEVNGRYPSDHYFVSAEVSL
jgi:endonuclease/exonuclease/phosphatase family metal-dependent hydrolase